MAQIVKHKTLQDLQKQDGNRFIAHQIAIAIKENEFAKKQARTAMLAEKAVHKPASPVLIKLLDFFKRKLSEMKEKLTVTIQEVKELLQRKICFRELDELLQKVAAHLGTTSPNYVVRYDIYDHILTIQKR